MAKPRARQDSTPVGVPTQSNTPKIVGGGIVVLVVLLIAAILIAKPWDSGDSTSNNPDLAQFQSVTVDGDALPAQPEDQNAADPAIGKVAPNIAGKSFDGQPVDIKAGPRSKVVFFFAHWCPHCQREIPVVTKWLNENRASYDVDFYAVSTGASAQQPNFPPSSWFAREKFPLTPMADSSRSAAANSYGLSSYPYMVFLDKDNKVVARVSSELPESDLTSYVQRVAPHK